MRDKYTSVCGINSCATSIRACAVVLVVRTKNRIFSKQTHVNVYAILCSNSLTETSRMHLLYLFRICIFIKGAYLVTLSLRASHALETHECACPITHQPLHFIFNDTVEGKLRSLVANRYNGIDTSGPRLCGQLVVKKTT
jgi:hypothetical protein